MKVKVHLDALLKNKWSDYALRFVIGGAVTVATGLVAAKWGPVVGGLFLAFPAIFPGGATLIEKQEKMKKLKAGKSPGDRGSEAVALDVFGSALGCIGLIAFAVLCWSYLPHAQDAPSLGREYGCVVLHLVAVLAYVRITVMDDGRRSFDLSRMTERRPVFSHSVSVKSPPACKNHDHELPTSYRGRDCRTLYLMDLIPNFVFTSFRHGPLWISRSSLLYVSSARLCDVRQKMLANDRTRLR